MRAAADIVERLIGQWAGRMAGGSSKMLSGFCGEMFQQLKLEYVLFANATSDGMQESSNQACRTQEDRLMRFAAANL